jgi:drug/metabolite transporter (DMT)-like permease
MISKDFYYKFLIKLMIRRYFLLFLMVCIWGFSFVLVDIAIQYIPPLSIALYRFLVASLTYLIIDVVVKIRQHFSKKQKQHEAKTKYTKKDLILLILSSFCGVSFFFLIQYTSIELVGPTLPALFVCLLSPLLISLLALIFFNEKLTIPRIIGFVISSIGAFFLITGGDIKNLIIGSPNFLGYFLALLTPLLWSLYSTFTKKVSKKQSDMKLNKYVSYFGTFELLVFVFMNNEIKIFLENVFNLFIILSGMYLGIGCYVLGYYIWQHSQNTLKSFRVASFLYIEPFLTLLFSIMLQRTDVLVIWNIIGGIIVLLGVLLINYH